MIKEISSNRQVTCDDILKKEFTSDKIPVTYMTKPLKECLEANEIVSIQARCRDIDDWEVVSNWSGVSEYADAAHTKRILIHITGRVCNHKYLVYEYMDHREFFWALRADMDKLWMMSKLNAGDVK